LYARSSIIRFVSWVLSTKKDILAEYLMKAEQHLQVFPVSIKNTKVATATDGDGNFRWVFPSTAQTLVITFFREWKNNNHTLVLKLQRCFKICALPPSDVVIVG